MQGFIGRPIQLGLSVASPAPVGRAVLAQQVTAAPVTPSPAVAPAPKPAFIDSALANSFIDVTGTIALGMMAYGAGEAKNTKLAYLFGIAAGALGFKSLVDIRNIREK